MQTQHEDLWQITNQSYSVGNRCKIGPPSSDCKQPPINCRISEVDSRKTCMEACPIAQPFYDAPILLRSRGQRPLVRGRGACFTENSAAQKVAATAQKRTQKLKDAHFEYLWVEPRFYIFTIAKCTILRCYKRYHGRKVY